MYILIREFSFFLSRFMFLFFCTGVCEVGCGGYICCCCMEGFFRFMFRRFLIREFILGMIVVAGVEGVLVGGDGWLLLTLFLNERK